MHAAETTVARAASVVDDAATGGHDVVQALVVVVIVVAVCAENHSSLKRLSFKFPGSLADGDRVAGPVSQISNASTSSGAVSAAGSRVNSPKHPVPIVGFQVVAIVGGDIVGSSQCLTSSVCAIVIAGCSAWNFLVGVQLRRRVRRTPIGSQRILH